MLKIYVAKTEIEMFQRLMEPFPLDQLDWRMGAKNKDATKAMMMPYLTSRRIMFRLDRVCGPLGWQSKAVYHPVGRVTVKSLGIRNPETCEWVWREDPGTIKGRKDEDRSIEALGGATVGFRRAAAEFGIGRYLYFIPKKVLWVPIVQQDWGYQHEYLPDLSRFSWCVPSGNLEEPEGAGDDEI